MLTTIWQKITAGPSIPASGEFRLVEQVRDRVQALRGIPDRELALRFQDLRGQAAARTLARDSELLIACFALVMESVRRVHRLHYFDVQLLAGLALTRRAIAEMQTGEGKTLVAALPAAYFALFGQGVHVMTVNTYLAARDRDWLQPVYQQLGLQVGLVQPEDRSAARRQAYACDITYGSGCEFGFDYLRDQLVLRQHPRRLGDTFRQRGAAAAPATVQRGHACAIVDEADAVLIDEATTPLIISEHLPAPAANAELFLAAEALCGSLVEDRDYRLLPEIRRAQLTEAGMARLAGLPPPVPTLLDRPWHLYLEQALTARHLLHRDQHYVVQQEKIVLVDPFTGRLFAERTWQDGLHQAVEAKEGVAITAEHEATGRISRQRYFGLYPHLCGMTGTASSAAAELRASYGLSVSVIPLHHTCRREFHPSRFFATQAHKFAAIASLVSRLHRAGQPALVGTRTIEQSEQLARVFRESQVPFRLLNGKQDEAEARIVAQAGARGAVTIATNMAGRGTDIRLAPEVASQGGLYVIGTERHESGRIDRQLVGRGARQGDPGHCQFFLSADDYLVQMYGPDLAEQMRCLAEEDGEIRVDLSREFDRLQQAAEGAAADRRRQVLAYDDWLVDLVAKMGD